MADSHPPKLPPEIPMERSSPDSSAKPSNKQPSGKRSFYTLSALGLAVLALIAVSIMLSISSARLDDAVAQASEDAKSRKAQLSELEKDRKQIDECQQNIGRLQEQLAKAKKTIAELRSEQSRLKSLVAVLQKKIEELEKRVADLEKRIEELEKRIEEISRQGKPFVNTVGMLFLPIPAGEFQMGSSEPSGEIKRLFGLTADEAANLKDVHPQKRKKISKPFFLAAHEVTQLQYEQVTGKTPWTNRNLGEAEGDDHPATYVTWEHAVDFCRLLTKKENLKYRLPTEAEWEYACRAGTETFYSFGGTKDNLHKLDFTKHAWFVPKAGNPSHHGVGRKWPNSWGLYDMHGNVWEWCQDTLANGEHVVRGGSVFDARVSGRSASRDLRPGAFQGDAGFRVLMTH